MAKQKLSPSKRKKHDQYNQVVKAVSEQMTALRADPEFVRAESEFERAAATATLPNMHGFVQANEQAQANAERILKNAGGMPLAQFLGTEIGQVDHLTILALISQARSQAISEHEESARKAGSDGAQKAHAADHARGELIQQAWAAGVYSSRNHCAQSNWQRLGFRNEETARSWLLNTPEPSPQK